MRAWVVSVYGTKIDGSTDSETVIIKSSDGSVIKRTSNISNVTGYTELDGDTPVNVTTLIDGEYEYMRDMTLNIEVYEGGIPTSFNRMRQDKGKEWTDRHQVSAYTNLQKVIAWWKNVVGRDSLDGKGGKVKLVTHQTHFRNHNTLGQNVIGIGDPRKDNAMWNSYTTTIYVCDSKDYEFTRSAALDVMAHEATHGVIHYGIGYNLFDSAFRHESVPKYINEAYADIFACIMTNDWRIAEDLYRSNASFDSMRNIAEPYDAHSIDAYYRNINAKW